MACSGSKFNNRDTIFRWSVPTFARDTNGSKNTTAVCVIKIDIPERRSQIAKADIGAFEATITDAAAVYVPTENRKPTDIIK